jgi:hypothetical protein
MPTTLEKAVQIATTVGQAESQERTGSAFFLEALPCHESHVNRSNESARVRVGKNKSTRGHRKPRKRQAQNKTDQSTEEPRCFECSGLGHYARECTTRRRTLEFGTANSKPNTFSGSPRNAHKKDASNKNGRGQRN